MCKKAYSKKHIGFEIRTISNIIKRCFEEKARMKGVEGLTGVQGLVVDYLYKQGRDTELFQRDVEKEFNIRRSTATGVLQLLERDGFITREAVAQDARLKSLKLTDKAIRAQKMIIENINELEEEIALGLTEEEVNTLFDLLCRIKKNIE